jgi:Tol biopolymer transport system component
LVRLTDNGVTDRMTAWSPDGQWIVFSSNRDGYDAIYTMHPDGTGLTRLTDSTAPRYIPGWSPDGTKITYIVSVGTKDAPTRDLYIMNTDGTNQHKVASGVSQDNTNESVGWALLPTYPTLTIN